MISPARTITVSNTGDAPLVVGAPSVTGNTADFPFTNGCGSAVTGGSSCTISVQFMPSATGSRSGSLSIPSDALNAATVTAALTGNGTAPMIALSPTSLDFGTQPDDASIPPRSITLTNSGTATLTVTGITLTGGQAADYRQTNTCTTVAAGGTCSISVTFAPTDVGTRSAMLSIASDASAQASVVSLTGNAVSREQTTSNPSTGAQPVSLTASQGEIVSFTPVVTNPSGAGSDFTYPLGFFNFRAEGLPTSGTPATVTFTYTFPAGTQVDSYVKCRTPTDCSRFAGAVVSGNTLTLTITDNGAGDNDPAQGVIVDPGAPALSANRRLDVQSGGGSMSLLAVVLLGLGVLWQRARRQGVFMLGLMAFAGSASAQIAPHEAGIGSLYMGGSLAYAKASPDSASVTRNLRAQGFNVTADVEDTAPGGSLSVGWFYSHRAAVELQAIHAGKFESEVTGTTPAQAAAISAALVDELAGTGNGLGLNLRWDYPLGQHWDLVHRFGAYAWRTQVEVSDGSQTRESTKNGIGGHTSLGVHRWFNKNLSAGAGANLFRPNSDNTFWHVYVQMEYAIGSL